MSNKPITQAQDRPYVISIAGFDPTAGAGLLSDLKCFEAHRVYGFGVCTALTIQTDTAFLKNDWLTAEQIIAQLQPLLEKFPIAAIKIGLIKNLETLLAVCDYLTSFDSNIKIVLDPILKASAGYNFHDWNGASVAFKNVLKRLYLITPNYLELQDLIIPQELLDQDGLVNVLTAPEHSHFSAAAAGTSNGAEIDSQQEIDQVCLSWSADCSVLLKGGHHPLRPGTDYLFLQNERLEFKSGSQDVSPKHGSGCVLSSAITAQLALGNSVSKSCLLSKQYIEKFLNSNTSLLGYHNS